MNNGTKQATIAYKTTPNGDPVDIDGQLTSISDKRQAIALLVGRPNPNPTLYEVEFYFSEGGVVTGNPTTIIDLEDCPVSIFTIDRTYIILHPGNIDEVINIYASFGWLYVGTFDYATASPITGTSGSTPVTITRTATLGQGLMNFQDVNTGQIKSVYVVNTDALGWILETGFWNNLRFWEASGVWNY